MKRPALLLFLVFSMVASAGRAETTLTIVHFSDYHSHAVPFSEGGRMMGGIARLIGYLQPYAKRKDTLIFSGGDMMNAGSPSWSDKYQCAEWPWFNGVVDVMAYGNHDSDYGPAEFDRCRKSVSYPILSANTYGAGGAPLFASSSGQEYLIFKRAGLRIGTFAIAGNDFEKLIPPAHRPDSRATFGDPVSAARRIVETLRTREKVNLIVLIGHEHTEDDEALARAVPGIDLILGTHSHRRQELHLIPGTRTYMISPYQYGVFVSRVDLHFSGRNLKGIEGRLVPIDDSIPEDAAVKRKVRSMETDLERDPRYAASFAPIGSAAVEISTANGLEGESPIGDFVTDVMRTVTRADIAISAASSFRQSLPSGALRLEDLKAAMPYDNTILVYDLPGAAIRKLLDYSVSRSGSDFFSQVSGLSFEIRQGQATDVMVLGRDGTTAALRDDGLYRVATTDYQARVATGYKDIFGGFTGIDSGQRVRSAVEERIRTGSPVTARVDGRINGRN